MTSLRCTKTRARNIQRKATAEVSPSIIALGWSGGDLYKLNAIVCGMLAVIFAVSGLYRSEVRFLHGVLAAWLFTSSIFVSACGASPDGAIWPWR